MTIIFQERIDALNIAIQQMPEEWRYRWCGPGTNEPVQDWHACACMGAANCSGKLGASFTKEEWYEWVAQNPPKIPGIEKYIDENGRYDKAAHDEFHWRGDRKRLEKAMKVFTSNKD